jgi:hypothetical protein
MPDRAVIALFPTFALAFLCGVMGAAYELHGSSAFWLGFAGAMAALVAGAISTFRAHGEPGERRIVGFLRAILDVAIFTLVYLGLLAFLRDAQPVVGVLLVLVAGGCALALARLRVRDADELRDEREGRDGRSARRAEPQH